jgi:peptidoglycan hydrolase-like protein with peptidoglycan-binding domain
MRMLRRAAILLGLCAVLAVGVVLIGLGDTLRRDEAILEWSNVLVSKEFGTTSRPRFLSQAILKGALPNIWVVSGEIALPDTGDGETRDGYVAVVRQVCAARREEKCWALQSLALGGEGPAASVAGVSRDGAVTEIQLAPAAETSMDTAVLRDSPQIGASISRSPEMPSGVDVEESVLRTTDEADVAGEKKLIWLTQRALKTLRYDPGPLDGRLGPQTTSAIESYRRDYDLAADGRPAHSLLQHMKEEIRPRGHSGPEDNRLVETEANPFVEEAAQTTGEVSIVIDDADTDVSEAPKAADSAAENEATGTIEVSVINTENKVNGIVFLIQDRLNRLGYAKPTPLELDGQFGPRTREAIAIYQRAHGLKIDGRASRELLHHIEKRVMNPAQVAELKIPTQVTVVKAPSQGGFRVQLGAFKSSEGAPKLWRTLQSRHSDLLGGLEHQIRRVDHGDRGNFYHLYAGPLPTASSANSLCHTLIERKADCLAVKS